MGETNVAILGSIAYDNIFLSEGCPSIGERVIGEPLGTYIGGMAANQALALSKFSINPFLIGKVGDNADGDRVAEYLEANQIATDYLYRDPESGTGQTYMFLVDDRDYYSVVVPGANWKLKDGEITTALNHFKRGDFLLAQLEVNTGSVQRALSEAHEAGLTVVLCASPVEYVSGEMLRMSDVVILNQHEAHKLWDLDPTSVDVIWSQLQSRDLLNDKTVVITLGDQGTIAKHEGQLVHAPTPDTEVEDTIGAGDAFTGVFVGSLIEGNELPRSLILGNIAGALTVCEVGAQQSAFSKTDILEHYQNHQTEFDESLRMTTL